MTAPVSSLGPTAFDLDRIVKSPRIDVSSARAVPPPVERFESRAVPLPAGAGGPPPSSMHGRAFARVEHAPPPAVQRVSPHDADEPLWKAAQEFEAIMLSQMFDHMFKGIETNTLFGGGHAESVYRTFLMQTYGEAVAENGGIGIAEVVYRDIARAYAAQDSGEWS